MKTAIITSDSSTNHLTGAGHPEQPDRVNSVINKLKQNEKSTDILIYYRKLRHLI